MNILPVDLQSGNGKSGVSPLLMQLGGTLGAPGADPEGKLNARLSLVRSRTACAHHSI